MGKKRKSLDEKGVEEVRGVPVSKLKKLWLAGSGPEYLKLGRVWLLRKAVKSYGYGGRGWVVTLLRPPRRLN